MGAAFGESFKLKSLNHQLFRHLMEYAMKAKFVSILILVDIAIPATVMWLKGFKDHVVAARPKPLDVKSRVDMGFVNQCARRIEFSCNEEFLFAGFDSNDRFIF